MGRLQHNYSNNPMFKLVFQKTVYKFKQGSGGAKNSCTFQIIIMSYL